MQMITAAMLERAGERLRKVAFLHSGRAPARVLLLCRLYVCLRNQLHNGMLRLRLETLTTATSLNG